MLRDALQASGEVSIIRDLQESYQFRPPQQSSSHLAIYGRQVGRVCGTLLADLPGPPASGPDVGQELRATLGAVKRLGEDLEVMSPSGDAALSSLVTAKELVDAYAGHRAAFGTINRNTASGLLWKLEHAVAALKEVMNYRLEPVSRE